MVDRNDSFCRFVCVEEKEEVSKMKSVEMYAAAVLTVILLLVGCWQQEDQKQRSFQKETSRVVQQDSRAVGYESSQSVSQIVSKPDEAPSEASSEPESEPAEPEIQLVLVGDSRTQGLQLGSDATDVDFLADRGMNVSQVTTEEKFPLKDGSYGTVADVVAEKAYRQAVLMFGLNELGWIYESGFIEEYREAAKGLQAVQPNIEIYIHGILPVTTERSGEGDEFNNERIASRNLLLSQMAEEEGWHYIAPPGVLCGEDGALLAEATTDGIHVTGPYCQLWMDEIRKQTSGV